MSTREVKPGAADWARLAETLRERRRLIADREFYARDPSGHLTQLQLVSQAISNEAAALPFPPPQPLAHYLERCSFEKALAWIESETTAE